MSLLEKINSPEDLRRLRLDDLQDVAEEVRQYILETMSRVGGHTGASLGAVELAIALHSHLRLRTIGWCGTWATRHTRTKF